MASKKKFVTKNFNKLPSCVEVEISDSQGSDFEELLLNVYVRCGEEYVAEKGISFYC